MLNDLPDSMRLIDSLELFESNLKTHLFEFILTVMYILLQLFTNFIIKLLMYFIILFYIFIADKFSLWTMIFISFI